MMSAYALLTILLIFNIGRQGMAVFLDSECRPQQTNMILGGRNADPAPYMAVILLNNNPQCAGSLITNRFVLTAKHCTLHNGQYSVILGEYDTSIEEHEKEYRVENIIRHNVKDIDLALVELDKEVIYTVHIRPICILVGSMEKSLLNNVKEYILTGWGQHTTNRRKRPHILQQAELNWIDPTVCGEPFGFICAEKANQFACQGDSGGPLSVFVNYGDETVLAQVGVLHGAEDFKCDNFSLYADVVKFTPWIVDNL